MRLSIVAASTALVFGLAACQPTKTEEATVSDVDTATMTDDEKHAYTIGLSIGNFVKVRSEEAAKFGFEFNEELVRKGYQDGVAGQPKLTQEEMQAVAQAADMRYKEKEQEVAALASQANIDEGAAYLAENGQREGVITTESGLQYEILVEGDGAQPTADDTVTVHYRGTLLDGTEFDSSYSRNEPATFPLSRVISGWTEGVQLMKEGSKFRFHIPSNLAYGERATGKITPNSTLIFDVELLEIVKPEGE